VAEVGESAGGKYQKKTPLISKPATTCIVFSMLENTENQCTPFFNP
jgi:hypothetical protein